MQKSTSGNTMKEISLNVNTAGILQNHDLMNLVLKKTLLQCKVQTAIGTNAIMCVFLRVVL